MKLITKHNFYTSLFEKNCISDQFSKISIPNNNNDSSNLLNEFSEEKSSIYSHLLIPNYLKINTSNDLFYKKVTQKEGFGVNLSNYTNIDDFIKSNCSKNFKKVFFRSLNRLESSFNISYKMFFGAISEEDYKLTMDALNLMISNRFKQREGRNKEIEKWQEHYDQTYNLIKNKRASLFVIYNDDKPIEISLNYHMDSLMYSAISSFDLDYSKFSLGNIEIYKQLDWCLLNNITFFDMGYGYFDYKYRWSNVTYNFENYITSKNNKILVKVYAHISKYKFKIMNYLIEKKLNELPYRMLNRFKKPKRELHLIEYELIPLQKTITDDDAKKIIDINTDTYKYTRKPVYDYLYKSKEHIKNINVSKLTNKPNTYLIEGGDSLSEIVFKVR